MENEDEIFLESLVTKDVMAGEYSIKNTAKIGLPFGLGGYDLFVTNKRFFFRKKSIGVGIPIGLGFLTIDITKKNVSVESIYVDILQKLKLVDSPPDLKKFNTEIINKLDKESEFIIKNSKIEHITLVRPKKVKFFLAMSHQPNFRIELKSGQIYPFIVSGVTDYISVRDLFLKYYATLFIEKDDLLNSYYPSSNFQHDRI